MSQLRQAIPINIDYNKHNMNDEDRNYLKSVENTRPSFDVFNNMVDILTDTQKETDELQNVADTTLLETFEHS